MDIEWEISFAVRSALEIVKKAGLREEVDMDGLDCTVWSYADPWGAGMLIRYGGVNGEPRQLTVDNIITDARLLAVRFVDAEEEKYVEYGFDKTTAWTLYLSACLADVRAKYGED